MTGGGLRGNRSLVLYRYRLEDFEDEKVPVIATPAITEETLGFPRKVGYSPIALRSAANV
jgi:hypothetical protein